MTEKKKNRGRKDRGADASGLFSGNEEGEAMQNEVREE